MGSLGVMMIGEPVYKRWCANSGLGDCTLCPALICAKGLAIAFAQEEAREEGPGDRACQ